MFVNQEAVTRMAYLNEQGLHGQFCDLLLELGQMQNGPPSDLGDFIRGRPPIGELPPASMTILLIVARLVDSFGRLRTWMARNIDELGDDHETDTCPHPPHVREVTIDFE